MTKAAAPFALACSLVGLAASATAAWVHYHLLFDPHYTSFCDVSETVSCTQVYSSRYASFHGVPVAIFGAIFFAFALLLVIAWMRASGETRAAVPGYLFGASTVALAVILYFAYTSFFVLKAVCLVCLTTYAAVIGLFLVTGAAAQVPMTSLPRRAFRDLRVAVASPIAIVLSILFLAGAGSAVAFFPRAEAATASDTDQTAAAPAATQDQVSELQRFMSTAPRVPLIVPADGAKVLIVKFNDYQCPACGQSYLNYKSIFAKYEASHPGLVKVVLKDYPLNPNCNPNLQNMVHPAACDAAVAVRLARMQPGGDKKAEALEDWLYTHQPTMTPQSVRDAAKTIAGVNNFDAMYASTLELVKNDTALGRQVGVRSTPTFFIDGVKVEGAMQPQFFDQAIAYELQRAGVTR